MTATTIRPRSRTDHARRGGHRTAITPPRQPRCNQVRLSFFVLAAF